MAQASSIAERAWVEAKAASDFAMLLPHLERNVELARRYAECYEGFPGFEHPYDALLDEYEPEMSTAADARPARPSCATGWSRSSPRPATPTRPTPSAATSTSTPSASWSPR